jgi:hypothetical protein
MSLRFISSQKGHPLLLHEGYVFRKEKETPQKIIWQCVEYKKNKCRGKFFSQFLQKNVGIQNFHLLCRIRYHIFTYIFLHVKEMS